MMMAFFSSITGSYVLALLMYALIFKIVFIPFTVKQQKNQIKMAGLAPKIQLIKAKYKGRNDQRSLQKQQEEIAELQQKEGYNGCSGCLPMLIQLPIIMLLYAVIQNPISYIANQTDAVAEYNSKYSDSSWEIPAELEDTIKELEAHGISIYQLDENGNIKEDASGKPIRVAINPTEALYKRYDLTEDAKKNEIKIINAIYKNAYNEDGSIKESEVEIIENLGVKFDSIPNFRLFGINLADTPDIMNPSIILIIPFLAAIASWISMWLTRKINGTGASMGGEDDQTAQSMKIMDITMPLMTLWIAFNFSGMLGLYWVFQSLLGLLQTLIVSRVMPIPKFTEEEIRELRRQEKEIEKAARSASKTTRHRSLHYIDEDDYDELPEAPQTESGKKKGSDFSSDAPEIKD